MKKSIKLAVLVFLALSYCFVACDLLYAAGKVGAKFLLIGVGARPAAMGGAFSGIANDINSIYWNTAGLSQIEDRQFSFMHNEWIADTKYEFVGYVHPLGANSPPTSGLRRTSNQPGRPTRQSAIRGVIGCSVVYLGMGDITGRAVSGKETEDFTASDMALTLSYGQRIFELFSIGINLKTIQQKISDRTANGIAADLGLLIKAHSASSGQALPLQFGMTVKNLGSPMKFVEEEYSLPTIVTLGVGYKFFDNMIFGLDISHQPLENLTNLSFGTEYCPVQFLVLRGGYLMNAVKSVGLEASEGIGNEFSIPEGLSGGIGLKIDNYLFDYAFTPFGELGSTHQISFSAKF